MHLKAAFLPCKKKKEEKSTTQRERYIFSCRTSHIAVIGSVYMQKPQFIMQQSTVDADIPNSILFTCLASCSHLRMDPIS